MSDFGDNFAAFGAARFEIWNRHACQWSANSRSKFSFISILVKCFCTLFMRFVKTLITTIFITHSMTYVFI